MHHSCVLHLRMRRLLLAAALAFVPPTFADDGADISVTVTNIPAAKGDLLIGLYNSATSFLVSPTEPSPKVPLKSTNPVSVRFVDVPPGTYAVAVIQDLNENGKLDKNFIGMPKEPLAFSVIEEIPKGKPKFSACSFEVAGENLSMVIPLTLE